MKSTSCWYSFKDESGLPILFYNTETGEHRWANKHVKCSRATLDEIPPQGDQYETKILRRKIKTYQDIATETDKEFLPTSQLYKDATTSTDNIFLEDDTSFMQNVVPNKEKETYSRHENLSENSYDDCEQEEFNPASPPCNPFCVDIKVEDSIDHEYGQSKESLVHNLFAMELSSVLSEEDFRQGNNSEKECEPIIVPDATQSGFSNTLESNVARNEELGIMENGREREEKTDEFDPPIMKIKVEPETEHAEEEQTAANMDTTAGDFSLVDLLPKNHVHKYICSICQASFKTSSNLERHNMFVHSDVMVKPRPHACTICDKRFVEANCLKKHLRTHTGEKPYRCPFCSKCFTQSQNLNKHKYIHTGSRPHQCKDCGKTFRQHSHLARHKLIHTGEKPYHCGECPKNYRTRSHLMRHFKSSNHKEIIDKTKKS